MLQPRPQNAYDDAIEFLYGRINYERTGVPPRFRGLKLDRMRNLLNRLGNPHHGLRIVHVGGTKGKGSTAAMVAAVLQSSGHRTGLYTSPHLDRIEERLAVDGQPCPPDRLAALTAHMRPFIEEMDRGAEPRGFRGPTFFEIITAMALLHFSQQQVTACVLEVGLGGRLDSTNVCQPLVSVITSISFDHMRQLGNTLELIAAEKAGIIKPGIPVISGVTAESPANVIRQVANNQQSRLFELNRDFELRPDGDVDGDCYTYAEATTGTTLSGVRIGLLGHHQAQNAAVAIATVRRLIAQGWTISDQAIIEGIARARCPARIERIVRRPDIIVDAAHNVASIQALVDFLDQQLRGPRRVLIFASSGDKDVQGMLRLLVPRFDDILLTRFQNNPRSIDVRRLQRFAEQACAEQSANVLPRIQVVEDACQAWTLARRMLAPTDQLCIAGSFFLAAELRGAIIRDMADNASYDGPPSPSIPSFTG